MSWFILSIIAALFWGFENFLYKTSARRNYNSAKITAIFGITVTALSVILFFLSGEKLINPQYLLLIGFLNAVAFFISLITRFEALKKVAISIFYPINRTGSLLLMVVFSYTLLHQNLTSIQIVGLVFAVTAIYLLSANKNSKESHGLLKTGLILTFASTVFSALGNLTLEYASDNVGTYAFTFLAYGFSVIFSYILGQFMKDDQLKTNEKLRDKFGIYMVGSLIGVLNFVGLVLFIEALKTGPFSIVGAITNFSLLITLTLAILIYKERPTVKHIFGIVLSFIALILFKL